MNSEPTGIFLADAHAQVRSALRLLLEQERGLQVVGEAGSPEEAVTGVRSSNPALILIDWEMPGIKGPRMVEILRDWCPSIRVIALSSRPESRLPALAAGADGFLNKGEPPEKVLASVHSVLKGKY